MGSRPWAGTGTSTNPFKGTTAANAELGSTRGCVGSADEFTRETKVRALVDGDAPKPDGQGLSGRKDASALLNDAARLSGCGAGEDATTRLGEQSDEPAPQVGP